MILLTNKEFQDILSRYDENYKIEIEMDNAFPPEPVEIVECSDGKVVIRNYKTK